MILNKFVRRLLSTVITSASFSLGFGNVNAITEEHKKEIFSWAKMMKLSEDQALEKLRFELEGKKFCLVPVLELKDRKEVAKKSLAFSIKKLCSETGCDEDIIYLLSLNFLLVRGDVPVGIVTLLESNSQEDPIFKSLVTCDKEDQSKWEVNELNLVKAVLSVFYCDKKFTRKAFEVNELKIPFILERSVENKARK